MNQETLQVLIEEVARVALEEWDIRERIGHELGFRRRSRTARGACLS
jgi:hypothetical protein